MIDLETMIKSLRLAWLKRIFSENDCTWKNYFDHVLKGFGGPFLFHYNYNIKDFTISSQLPIYELLHASVSKRVLVHNHSNVNELRILMQIKLISLAIVEHQDSLRNRD